MPAGDTLASGIALLHASPHLELVRLFAPEHSITGQVVAGGEMADMHDPATGLPVLSLYGATERPTPGMLAGLGGTAAAVRCPAPQVPAL